MRPAPRRLTVLASLDVAGYTPLVERDERGTLAELCRLLTKAPPAPPEQQQFPVPAHA